MSGGGSSRAARLARLKAVQARKRQLEEWRLAELQRTHAGLEREIAEIIESLGDQSLLAGLFLDQKAAALRRKDRALAENRLAVEAARARLAEAAAFEKRVERAAEEAGAVERRGIEAHELAETLESFLSARSASLE